MNNTQTRLTKLVEECLKVNNPDPSIPLSDLGIDSIMFLRLRSQLRQEFQVELTVDEFIDNDTIEKMALLLESKP